MRPFMLLAVSVIALSGASFGQANAGTFAGAAALRGADQLRLAEPVARSGSAELNSGESAPMD